ncbi:MAG: hypothetical protein AB7L66_11405 [Gemmatimonadales bacterium]
MTTDGRSLGVVLALACCARLAAAQPILYQPVEDSPILARNRAGPAELAQYDFLAGDWDVTVTMPRAGGEPLVFQAKWHNHWIANGSVMMQEWRGPYATGIELRSFNPVTRKWDGRNLYVPDPGTWYETEAELVGAEMVVTRRATAPDGSPVINREVYHAITADRFLIRTEMSVDQGATWTPGRYRLVATRIR